MDFPLLRIMAIELSNPTWTVAPPQLGEQRNCNLMSSGQVSPDGKAGNSFIETTGSTVALCDAANGNEIPKTMNFCPWDYDPAA
jgi:hypothetical protein